MDRKTYMKNVYSKYWLTAREKKYGFMEYDKNLCDYVCKQIANGAKILEVAIGTGYPFADFFQKNGYSVYGIDISPKLIEKVNKLYPVINAKVGDAENIEYPDDFLDSPFTNNWYPGHVYLATQLVGRDLRGFNVDDDYFSSDTPRAGPFIKVDSIEFMNVSPIPGDPWPVMLCEWGEPILYFRATPGTTAQNTIDEIYDTSPAVPPDPPGSVAFTLALLGALPRTLVHATDPLLLDNNDGVFSNYANFYQAIRNESLEDEFGGLPIPYRGDSFILWSAGKDRIYGTEDDITNFN